MKIKFLLTLFIFCFTQFAFGGASLLNRKISIEIKSTPIKRILNVIEERAEVQFSYNPDLVEEDRIVSLSIQNKTIAFGLGLIFDGNVRFKEVGNHIILLKNENAAEIKKRRKANLVLVYKGEIVDKRTGSPLSDVSIYDVESRHASISDVNGNYRLEIPKEELVRSVYVRKKGFKEFVFVVDATTDSVVVKSIALEPLPILIEKIEKKETELIYQPIEDEAFSGIFISYETYIHGENLEEIKASRVAQISLVPSVSIGSNLSTNGLITNNFSLNVLAGYSSGIDGAEIGGILNIIKEDGRWFQAGGIFNLVGGNFQGAQFGGIANSVRGNYTGAQFGGIGSRVGKDFLGAQFSGIASMNHRNFTGGQFGGISAITKGDFVGAQFGGILGAVRGGFRGIQVGGIATSAYNKSYGLQLGGIRNDANDGIVGGQIAGIANRSKGGISFLQIGGISNVGFLNRGLQIGGIFNYTKKNDGLQIGLINTSTEGNGIAFGLINFVRKGYHKTEIEANETFPLSLTFKSGVRHFYNSYSISVRFLNDRLVYAAGMGFGTAFSVSEKIGLNFDLSGKFTTDNQTDSFTSVQLYQFSPTVDFKMANWVHFFVGPSFNANLTITNGEPTDLTELTFSPIYNETVGNSNLQLWIGGKIGFRL